VVSRAGSTIAELCIVRKPAILVPSPNVAEDHQTHNAMALVKENAAIFIADNEAEQKLVDTALELLNNQQKQKELSTNISKMAMPDADEVIAKEVMKLAVSS
jgi:UDP-N-acetylglucosamine--N-acetylmuramyl-(pentapeptide) pyrophosphoryl-undecaprenol N-acetylglucosamine transferase